MSDEDGGEEFTPGRIAAEILGATALQGRLFEGMVEKLAEQPLGFGALATIVVAEVFQKLPEPWLAALLERGGPRWGEHGFVFSMPTSNPNVSIGVELTVGGGGRVKFWLTDDAAGFAPEVYDFARLGDALFCAIDVVVSELIKPRARHRWCRRATYGQGEIHRTQFLHPSGPFVPLPLPLPGELEIPDEDGEE